MLGTSRLPSNHSRGGADLLRASLPPRRTIWIVDDSKLDAERVRDVLGSEHTVEVMYDGSTVLERLATERPPDLLVVDWVMPGIAGVDLCRYLRSPECHMPDVPILLLTVLRDTNAIVEGLNAGANDYLAKPFADEELEARVAALLRSKELLERAEQAEASVQALLANAPDAIVAIDAEGAIVFANIEAARALGQPEAQLLGLSLNELVPALGIRNISVAPGESLPPLPDVCIGDRVFSPSVRVLPSDSGARTTVCFRDVTAQRQADARRLDFYSIIAHDLRTPLNTILLRLGMALDGHHGVLPPSLVGELRKVEGGTLSLIGMINDFLDLARLEGTGHKVDLERLDVGALVAATMEDFRPLLETHGLTWVAAGLQKPAWVAGDRKRLAQVLANLVGNAIKFTPRGGTITTTVVVAEDHVEVSVEDTGRGIQPAFLPDVFQRYVRGQQQPPSAGGAGLGLMIVREIVEAHGGKVGVESQVDEGSRFWFWLPSASRG